MNDKYLKNVMICEILNLFTIYSLNILKLLIQLKKDKFVKKK